MRAVDTYGVILWGDLYNISTTVNIKGEIMKVSNMI